MSHSSSRPRALSVFGCLLVLVLLPSIGSSQKRLEVSVRYRSEDTVYLDAGTYSGLAEGDRLEVFRAGHRIGEVEVTFVAEYSASCRIVAEDPRIQPDDRARRLETSPQPTAIPMADAGLRDSPAEPTTEPEVAAQVEAYQEPRSSRSTRPLTQISGIFELGWDSFTDDSGADLDFDQIAARLSLRIRNIAGRPLQLRVRMRALENQRARAFSNGAPETEKRNRFYEAAVLYDPEQGRFKGQIGRIAVSPFIAVGYLDGFIGQVRLLRGIDLGVLVGSQPVIQTDGFFETKGQKYGAYSRFSAFGGSGRPDLEIFVAGIREEGDEDVSREYVSLETRYTPLGRWSFYQRAEIDLNNGWRETAVGTTTQLSNLALGLDTQISHFSRFSISYDRWERYLTEESRSLTEELFDNLLRQGLRARYSYGRPRGLGFSIYAGYRDREGDDENTVSVGGNVRHSNIGNWGLMVGGDLLGYSNPVTEGFVARLQTSKRFSGGHEVALLLGGRFYSNKLFDDVEDQSDQWIRLSGWVELPYDLFARAEFEYSDGDSIQGQRILLSAGYRL